MTPDQICCDADAEIDPLDPYGNITIKWDIVEWTGDGYRVGYLESFAT